MYEQHFGLSQAPFSIAPDPRFLFMSARHREALAHLLYGLERGGGFVVLTGEVGAGKTTVCRRFLKQIPPHCNVAYVLNPKCTAPELLRAVCSEFGIVPGGATEPGAEPLPQDSIDALNAYLLRTHAAGQINLLIIDEAQNLSADVLEQLRLLTNLETDDHKLLQILLIGQPELRGMLARPELSQLAQRVIARFHLEALSQAETEQYIRHRLKCAGGSGIVPFTREARQRIHRLSKGVPRRINLLCDRTLLGAYGLGRLRADRHLVDSAAREVFPDEARRARQRRARVAAAGALVAAVVASVIAWAWGGELFGAATQAAPHARAAQGPAAGAPVAAAGVGAAASSPASSASTAPASAAASPSFAAVSPASPAPAPAPAPAAPVIAARATGVPAPLPAPGAPAAHTAPVPPPVRAAGTSAAPVAGGPGPAGPGLVPASLRPGALPGTAAELKQRFPSLITTEREAWRALAPWWKLAVGEEDPCRAAREQQVQCFTALVDLDLVRKLDRPAILTLYDDAHRPMYALLTGLSRERAQLSMGGAAQDVPLALLESMWRGEYATYWVAPAGFAQSVGPGSTGPVVRALSSRFVQLDKLPPSAERSRFDAALRTRVMAFQVMQGLRPDGVVGPVTFMQLNRATGVSEPQLQARPAGQATASSSATPG